VSFSKVGISDLWGFRTTIPADRIIVPSENATKFSVALDTTGKWAQKHLERLEIETVLPKPEVIGVLTLGEACEHAFDKSGAVPAEEYLRWDD